MSRIAEIAAVAFATLFCATTAHAGCGIARDDVRTSGKYNRVAEQAMELRPDRPDEENGLLVFAAHAGHVLGQQVQHLGTDAGRREWFDCITKMLESDLAATALDTKSNPVEVDQAFQAALLGVLSDEQMSEFGIDPNAEVTSIFDEDWTGSWDVTAKMRTPLGHEFSLLLVFDMSAEPTTVTMIGDDDKPRTVPAAAAGDVVTFRHNFDGQNLFVWELVHREDRCTGGMTWHAPKDTIPFGIVSCVRAVSDAVPVQ